MPASFVDLMAVFPPVSGTGLLANKPRLPAAARTVTGRSSAPLWPILASSPRPRETRRQIPRARYRQFNTPANRSASEAGNHWRHNPRRSLGKPGRRDQARIYEEARCLIGRDGDMTRVLASPQDHRGFDVCLSEAIDTCSLRSSLVGSQTAQDCALRLRPPAAPSEATHSFGDRSP